MNSIEAKLAVLISNRWWDHLEPFCDEALAADPDSSLALTAKGWVLLRKDNLPAARQAFLDALQADAGDACRNADFMPGVFAAATSNRPSNTWCSCWPSIPRAKVSTSRIAGFTRRSAIRRAEEAIDAALQLFPTNEHVLGARLYHARRHWPDREVRNLCTSLLELYPENAFAHFCLGEQCLKHSEFDSAREHLQTCMTIAPSDATARMLKFVEVRRTGRGSLTLFLWAIKRKLLKLLVPGYSQRERSHIDWDR